MSSVSVYENYNFVLCKIIFFNFHNEIKVSDTIQKRTLIAGNTQVGNKQKKKKKKRTPRIHPSMASQFNIFDLENTNEFLKVTLTFEESKDE